MLPGDIKLSSNFDLSSQRPLDARITTADIAGRDAIPEVSRYNLIRVDVLDTGIAYQLVLGTVDSNLANNLNWIETSSKISGIISTSGDSFVSFENSGADEFVTIQVDSLLAAQWGGSGHSKLMLDPGSIRDNTTGLSFGSGVSQFYESSEGILNFSGTYIQSTAASGGYILINEISTATNPVYSSKYDITSGLGFGTTAQTSLIADGNEGIRVSSAAIDIFHSTLFAVDVTITGDLTVNGTTITANTETVLVEDNIMVVNYGETGSGITAGSAGTRVDRGTATDYMFVFDEVRDAFVVGEGANETAPTIALLQPVATREDSPIDTGIALWDTSTSRFITEAQNDAHNKNYAGSGGLFGTADTISRGDHSHNAVISLLTNGAGLTGNNFDGSSPETWAVAYAGTGSANTSSRSDHTHATITKVLAIGAWDMLVLSSITVAHGIASGKAKIVGIDVVILEDTGAFDNQFLGQRSDLDFATFNDTVVTLFRKTGGIFDSASYEVLADRGRVLVTYLP